jgi:putative iron-regulated protein
MSKNKSQRRSCPIDQADAYNRIGWGLLIICMSNAANIIEINFLVKKIRQGNIMTSRILFYSLFASFFLIACQPDDQESPGNTVMPADANVSGSRVIDTYTSIARATYEDSLFAAKQLAEAVDRLLENPGQPTLDQARQAWLAARVPYQQTEVFRFGNPVVDAWEGRVNAWPLDEGLIDYTDQSYGEESEDNPFYTANIIANPSLEIAGILVDASVIDASLLADVLHEIDEQEANVATGYHAIEFLLWGQDLNGTDPGAGARPWTDYSLEACTHGHCDRRRAYLQAVTGLLVDDLEEMVGHWQPGGAADSDLRSRGEAGGLASILTGMGSLAYGELAGERIRLALLLNDPEEESDCFSDNTHLSHYYSALGIKNIYNGQYRSIDGALISGPALADLVAQVSPQLAEEMSQRLAETESAMDAMVAAAETGNTFDVLIAPGNSEGAAILNRIIDALIAQTRTTENMIAALGLANTDIQGADSLEGL